MAPHHRAIVCNRSGARAGRGLPGLTHPLTQASAASAALVRELLVRLSTQEGWDEVLKAGGRPEVWAALAAYIKAKSRAEVAESRVAEAEAKLTDRGKGREGAAAAVGELDRLMGLSDEATARCRDIAAKLPAEPYSVLAAVAAGNFHTAGAALTASRGQAAGVALVAAAEAGCEVAQYTSNEVKLALVGYGGATKDQVQRMVASVLGLPEPPRPPDVADALALAACHLTTNSLRRAVDAATARVPADPPVTTTGGAR